MRRNKTPNPQNVDRFGEFWEGKGTNAYREKPLPEPPRSPFLTKFAPIPRDLSSPLKGSVSISRFDYSLFIMVFVNMYRERERGCLGLEYSAGITSYSKYLFPLVTYSPLVRISTLLLYNFPVQYEYLFKKCLGKILFKRKKLWLIDTVELNPSWSISLATNLLCT